jgi:amino acid adenylation domain-containing protein
MPSATLEPHRRTSDRVIEADSRFQASNLTLRQFRFWQEQELHPEAPVERIFRVVELPDKLAVHLDSAWQFVTEEIDAARALLVCKDSIPRIEFGRVGRTVDFAEITATEPLGAGILAWARPEWLRFAENDRLIKQALISVNDGRKCWLITASHLVCDGRAMDLLYAETLRVMEDLAEGRPLQKRAFPSLQINMAVERHRDISAEMQNADAAITTRIAELKSRFQLFGRSVSPDNASESRGHLTLSKALTDRLIDTARSAIYFHRSTDVTLSNMLTALAAAWVYRHGGQHEFIIGIPFHGRAADEQTLIGFKSEILPFGVTVDPQAPFLDLVKSVNREAATRLKHRGRTFANPRYAPNYHVRSNYMFVINKTSDERAPLARIEIPASSNHAESVVFTWSSSTEDNGQLRVGVSLNEAFLQYTDMDRVLEGLHSGLEELVANPMLRVRDLSFFDRESARAFVQLPVRPNGDSPMGWLSRWTASLGEIGSLIAVAHGNEPLTHRELHTAAARWLTCLQTHGMKTGDAILVWSASSNALSAAYLAIVSSGCSYVPMHINSSAAVIAETAQRLGASLVLCAPGKERELIASGLKVLALSEDTARTHYPGHLDDPLAEGIAHIFHTSGSTGIPKAIAVSHGALAAFTRSWIEANALQNSERILHFYSITFDPWLSGLLPAIWLGGSCIVSQHGQPPTGEELLRLLAEHAITTLCTPTAYFHALCELPLPSHVKRWIVGGEALAADKARRFLRSQATAQTPRLINAYGPTETTVWTSILEVRPEHETGVPIGKSFPTVGYRVCDDLGNLLPFGVPGELWICGPQVAVGYAGQPELTARQFVEIDGQRWYKTGDMVRWRHDGDLDFLGRKDRQLQVRGYRVEPGEIEIALRTLSEVGDAVVVPVQLKTTTALCAYVIAKNKSEPPDSLKLRAELLRSLSEYKVPKWILVVDSFPKNGNGKIDLARLPPPNSDREETTLDRLPSLTLWDLRLIFEAVLGLPRIKLDDDFFDLGGDSLLLVELLAVIEKRFGKTLEPIQVMQHPTIGGLAPLLEAERLNKASLIVEMKSGTRPPLFCIPGAGGIGVEFYPLSRRLPDGQPVVVLRSSGTDGHSHPPGSIDELLEEHIAHILAYRAIHGNSQPVHLAGYSLGGIFAYEVAQRLKSRHIPVGRLFIIDAHIAVTEGRGLFKLGVLRSIKQKRRKASNNGKLNERSMLAAQLDEAIRTGRIMEASALGRYNLMVQAGFFNDIHSTRGAFDAIYFLATNGPRLKHSTLWQKLVTGLTVETIRGDHDGDNSIVREPNVAGLASIIESRLRD